MLQTLFTLFVITLQNCIDPSTGLLCNNNGICNNRKVCECLHSTGQYCDTCDPEYVKLASGTCKPLDCVNPKNNKAVCSGNGVCTDNLECFCTGDSQNAPSLFTPYCSECITGYTLYENSCLPTECFGSLEKPSAPCSGHGACAIFGCTCDFGWNGATCSQQGCTPGNTPNIYCSNRGACVLRKESHQFECACSVGSYGQFCQTVGCNVSSGNIGGCGAHGTCVYVTENIPGLQVVSTYSCVCEENSYLSTLSYCTKCLHNLDLISGICANASQCLDNFGNICSHHGACKPLASSTLTFGCECDYGYAGTRCEILGCTKMNTSTICSDNGICVILQGQWSCSCNPGHYGIFCESANIWDSADTQNALIATIVVVVIVLVISISVGMYFLMRKKKYVHANGELAGEEDVMLVNSAMETEPVIPANRSGSLVSNNRSAE